MKAIFINSKEATSKSVDIDLSGDAGYMKISEMIGCEYFTTVTIKRHEDGTTETLYCDDEGAINNTRHGVVHFSNGLIFGNCLILGTNQAGESIDTKLTPDSLWEQDIGLVFALGENDKPVLKVLKEIETK